MIIRVQCSSCWLVKNEKISRVCNDSLFYIMFITVELEIPRVKFYVYVCSYTYSY